MTQTSGWVFLRTGQGDWAILCLPFVSIQARKFSAKRRYGEDANQRLGLCRRALIICGVFNEIILDHFRNPRNSGKLDDATATVEVTNPVCGDILRLSVRMEGGRIAAARFKTQGCVCSIAASSVLTDLLIGKTPAEARELTAEAISDALGGLPLATFHAAQLCCDAAESLLRELGS